MSQQQHMLTLIGQVINVFQKPDGIDKETGAVRVGAHTVQIMGNSIQ